MGLSMSFFTFMYLSSLFFFQLTSSRKQLCHDHERLALLQFKESFVINKFASNPSGYPKVTSWNLKENRDCCSWDGVKCSEETGYVMKLDLGSSCLYGSINSTSTLFNLVHLQWLSLASNDFNGSTIPFGIMNLSKLSHLNLSRSGFSGQIPPEMLELSNLESLDLSYSVVSYNDVRYNPRLQLQQPGLENLVDKLTNLKLLHLGRVDISSSMPHVLSLLINLSSLEFLSLSSCNLEGTIPSSISHLNNLTHLDLSDNNLIGTIPSSIGHLNNLAHLELLGNNLNGIIPSSIGHLNNLTHLGLSDNNLNGTIPSSIGHLNNLTDLDLSDNNLIGTIPSSIGHLNNLARLDLSNNSLNGIISSSLANLTNLIDLDLSYNNFNFEGKLPTSIGNLASLETLKIESCNFSVQESSSFSNLTQLKFLDLADNNISSPSSFLSWIGNSTKLILLDLAINNILGEIPFWLVNLTHLQILFWGQNQLTGPIPFWLMKLNQLQILWMSQNQLIGQIPSQISNLTQLNELHLSSNQLQGSIPSSLFELSNLKSLDLSSNNLSGTMELEMFLHKLKSLRDLDLSSNRLSLFTNSTVNTSLQKFTFLKLRSCNLIGFPNFLRSQDQLWWLDLSSNNISGEIPGWLFNLSIVGLYSLNLSHNLLTGFDQQHVLLPWTSLEYLDLRFNKLQGPLPIPPVSTIHYLVSNNKLSGEIPLEICKLNSLYAFDLSNNNFSGKLPDCLGNFSYGLSMLDLQNNGFYGSIPRNFKYGTNLRMIDLSNNLFGGKFPRSLVHCTQLEFLDLGNNKINDTFPSWMGSLPKLEVLNLQSNELHGVIEEPTSNFEFPKLRMIDLSHNKFTGKFPSKSFQLWNAMKVVNDSHLTYMMKENYSDGLYDYSLTVVNKGIEIEYVKIPNMLTGIWLSSNRFEGEIPTSISILKGLRYLDLSNNNLVGGIPSSLGNLTVLESLVLSNNKLSGEIPQQLVNLTCLAFFNVSYNHLEGPIPHGAQFNTFDNTSYEGNLRLCGQPLSKKCENSEVQQEEDDHESELPFAFGWKVVAIGYACGLIIGVVLGHICLIRKHEWFAKIFRMPAKRMQRKKGRRRN